MKNQLIKILLLLVLAGLLLSPCNIYGKEVYGKKVVPLPDLLNAEAIALDDGQMYIVDGSTVHIYRLKDAALVKSFGKKGEGPQEFMVNPQSGRPLFIDVQGDAITITSMGKVSFFNKSGEFIKEMNIRSSGSADNVQPLGKGFVGQSITPGNTDKKRGIILYDGQMVPVKTLLEVEHHFQLGKGLKVFREPGVFITRDGKLYVTWDAEFRIRVMDAGGEGRTLIERPYKRLKVREAEKEEVIAYLKKHPFFKNFFELLKPIRFPEYFPAISEMRIADNKIYLLTYKEDKGKTECFIYTLEGKLLGQAYLPLQRMSPLFYYPFDIKDGVVYQVVEDEEAEAWSLHVSGF